MRNQFPLLAKIVCWLLLNVLLVAAVGWIIVQQQMRLGFDSLLGGRAGDRIRSVAGIVIRELNESRPEEWTAVLAKFDGSYPVDFHLFTHDGTLVAGKDVALPAELVARLLQRQGPPPHPLRRQGEPGRFEPREQGRMDGPPDFDPPPPLENFGEPSEAPPDRRRAGNENAGSFRPQRPPGVRVPELAGLFHGGSPKRYFLLIHAPLDHPPPGGPFSLILTSSTLSAGGLFVDLSPFAVTGLAALILSVFFWLPLVRGITHSIATMRDATMGIAEGRFDVRVDDRRRDELGTLGGAINSMSERLASLVDGQRRFLSDVAHELCAPLSRLQMALGILEARAVDADRERLLDLREEVDHVAGLVNELLSFSRAALGSQNIRLGPVDVVDCIEKAVHRESCRNVQIEILGDRTLFVVADLDMLLRAIGNLLRNAIRYAGDAGPIAIVASSQAGMVQIDVEDCGPGVPQDSLAQLFDPFFRVDSSRTRETGGVGLGLTIAKTCVAACGGSILARNRRPAGLCVSIRLPPVFASATMPEGQPENSPVCSTVSKS